MILAAASLIHSETHVTLFYSHIMAVEEFEYAYAHLSFIKVEIGFYSDAFSTTAKILAYLHVS